jgi:hemolysin activation/secretion protein
VNLNLNPDRYVSAVISRGDDPNSLAVEYRVYEANPWHFFVQADNSGTEDIQWAPRFGVVNTNLLGFDDKLTAVYQTPLDSDMGDQYAVYGSYDFPIWGPKLRLNSSRL